MGSFFFFLIYNVLLWMFWGVYSTHETPVLRSLHTLPPTHCHFIYTVPESLPPLALSDLWHHNNKPTAFFANKYTPFFSLYLFFAYTTHSYINLHKISPIDIITCQPIKVTSMENKINIFFIVYNFQVTYRILHLPEVNILIRYFPSTLG